MTVDKRINYFKGGGYQGGTNTSDRITGGQGRQVARDERANRRTVPSGNTGSNDRQSYNVNKSTVDVGGGKARKLNARDYALLTRNNYNRSGFGGANRIGGAGRFDDMYTGGGLKDLFKGLLSFKVPGAGFLFNKGKQGIAGINNFMGNLREDLTGYRTQQEYDDARQQRINLNRINTIQNTLDRKYSDGDYSNTDLDERLAALKQSMGILDVTPVNEVDNRPTQTFSFDNSVIKQVPQNPSELYINSTPFTNNPVGGLDQYAKEMEALTKRGEDYYFPDELGGTLQDFYLNKNPLLGDLLDLSEKDEFEPNPFLPLEPTNFNTDQSGITIKTPNNMGKDFFDASSLLEGSGIINAIPNNPKVAGLFKTKTQKLLEDMANSGEIKLPGTASASEVEQTPVNIEATDAQIAEILDLAKSIGAAEGQAEYLEGIPLADKLGADIVNQILALQE
jgi:hypothetical protein